MNIFIQNLTVVKVQRSSCFLHLDFQKCTFLASHSAAAFMAKSALWDQEPTECWNLSFANNSLPKGPLLSSSRLSCSLFSSPVEPAALLVSVVLSGCRVPTRSDLPSFRTAPSHSLPLHGLCPQLPAFLPAQPCQFPVLDLPNTVYSASLILLPDVSEENQIIVLTGTLHIYGSPPQLDPPYAP